MKPQVESFTSPPMTGWCEVCAPVRYIGRRTMHLLSEHTKATGHRTFALALVQIRVPSTEPSTVVDELIVADVPVEAPSVA